jgi:hypothetical protein
VPSQIVRGLSLLAAYAEAGPGPDLQKKPYFAPLVIAGFQPLLEKVTQSSLQYA